jgi:hypothetical protein
LECRTFDLKRASFSPDGARIATATYQGAQIWDALTGKQIASLKAANGSTAVESVSFSPDGTRIVTASWDNARIWDSSRSALLAREEHSVVLTAALAHGIGSRTNAEAQDLLLQDAPKDGNLYAEALEQLGRTYEDTKLASIIAALAAPLHPNCYLSPTQFEEMFKARRLFDKRAIYSPVADQKEVTPALNPAATDTQIIPLPRSSPVKHTQRKRRWPWLARYF